MGVVINSSELTEVAINPSATSYETNLSAQSIDMKASIVVINPPTASSEQYVELNHQ